MANGRPAYKTRKAARMTKALRAQLGYLGDPEVAAVLGVEVPTLHNRRSRGDAPASAKVGAEHLTRIEDLHAYVARRRNASASPTRPGVLAPGMTIPDAKARPR